uniref:Reverse transcriptase domain-containing protein n=1 Tax=Cannabis sativa TaxID=3483 RepID=A0A803PT07_CANSA
MAHNVMIVQDLLKNYKRKGVSPRCDIKVDISKAYDTVSWDFLEDLLNAYHLPSRPTKWKAKDCGIIIKKMRQRLHTWASRHLSYAGRVQLIHSVLLGLRNYWMSIFVLPHSVTKEVEKICRGFLWEWNGNRSKIHLASWEKVCLPKNYGGLGFKDGIRWNHAFWLSMFGLSLLKETCFGSNGVLQGVFVAGLSGVADCCCRLEKLASG